MSPTLLHLLEPFSSRYYVPMVSLLLFPVSKQNPSLSFINLEPIKLSRVQKSVFSFTQWVFTVRKLHLWWKKDSWINLGCSGLGLVNVPCRTCFSQLKDKGHFLWLFFGWWGSSQGGFCALRHERGAILRRGCFRVSLLKSVPHLGLMQLVFPVIKGYCKTILASLFSA